MLIYNKSPYTWYSWHIVSDTKYPNFTLKAAQLCLPHSYRIEEEAIGDSQ